jgi:hypothetical protein
MRGLFACLLLTGCVATAEPRVIAETPASISYECRGAISSCRATPQDVANAAQAHCQKIGKNAQQKELGVAPSGDFRAVFVCS